MFNNNRKVFKKLDLILKYGVVVSLATLFFGFVFIQGTIINNVTSISDAWYKSIGLISNNLYIIAGILQITYLFIGILFSSIIFSSIYMIVKIDCINKLLIRLKNWIRIGTKNLVFKRVIQIIWLLLLIVLFYISTINIPLFLRLISGIKITNFLYSYVILECIYFIIYFLIKIIGPRIIGHLINIQSINLNIELGICLLISLTIFVYNQGAISFKNKVDNFNNGTGEIKMSTITSDDEQTNQYITIDITKDSFIGTTFDLNTIVNIPMDKISKIQTKESKKILEVKKYNLNNVNTQNSQTDINRVAATIINYYKYRTNIELNYAQEFITLLSRRFYNSAYSSIPSDILQKQWRKSGKLNNKELTNFISFQISEPTKNLVQAKEYNVSVVEYWANEYCYKEFTFVYENGQWKVDSIDDIDRFNFK